MMMKIIYLAEGLNCKFDRAVYDTPEAALADVRSEYPSAVVMTTLDMGGMVLALGHGSAVTITPVRLYERHAERARTVTTKERSAELRAKREADATAARLAQSTIMWRSHDEDYVRVWRPDWVGDAFEVIYRPTWSNAEAVLTRLGFRIVEAGDDD